MKRALCLIVVLLSGCSLFHHSDEKPEPTLASLKPARLPDATQPLPQVGLPQVAANYRAVLKSTDDPQLRARQIADQTAALDKLGPRGGPDPSERAACLRGPAR